MKDRLCALLLVIVLVLIVQLYPYGNLSGAQGSNAFSLGLVILTGYLVGEILNFFHLPRITGYLLSGMLFGPYSLALVSHQSVQDFLIINQIALALIALTAGGELRLTTLRKCWKGILCIAASQAILIFILGTLFAFFLISLMPFMAQFPLSVKWGIALVVGVIAIAQSPDATIAIITETRASGICTELALGVAVVKDVTVITLFTCVLMVLGMMDQGVETLEWGKLLTLGQEFLFSIGVGIGAGYAISFYLSRIRVDPILFLLAFCYMVSLGAQSFHLDALLVFVTAGIWVTNASSQGSELIETIENGSLIVYVIFFCVAGASLDLGALSSMWLWALLLVAFRMVLIAISTGVGARLARQTIPSLRTYWMVFLPQAGVSLGLVMLLQGEGFWWASQVKTLIVACIAINLILGPILMKYALIQSGETNRQKRSTR